MLKQAGDQGGARPGEIGEVGVVPGAAPECPGDEIGDAPQGEGESGETPGQEGEAEPFDDFAQEVRAAAQVERAAFGQDALVPAATAQGEQAVFRPQVEPGAADHEDHASQESRIGQPCVTELGSERQVGPQQGAVSHVEGASAHPHPGRYRGARPKHDEGPDQGPVSVVRQPQRNCNVPHEVEIPACEVNRGERDERRQLHPEPAPAGVDVLAPACASDPARDVADLETHCERENGEHRPDRAQQCECGIVKTHSVFTGPWQS